MKLNCNDESKETIRSRLQAGPRDRICLCAKRKANKNQYSAVSNKFSILYSQTCLKRPYKTRHIFGFSDKWLLIAA